MKIGTIVPQAHTLGERSKLWSAALDKIKRPAESDGLLARSSQTVLVCVDYELETALAAQFSKDRCQVMAHRSLSNRHSVGYSLVLQALADQTYHLNLALSQRTDSCSLYVGFARVARPGQIS